MLKLSSTVYGVEIRNKNALENQISYLDFLELLVVDDVVRRQTNGYQTKLRESKFHSQLNPKCLKVFCKLFAILITEY